MSDMMNWCGRLSAAWVSLLLVVAVPSGAPGQDQILQLHGRTQKLGQYDWGGNYWQVSETELTWRADQTALIICDVWDKHWSAGATRRVDQMAPRMNIVVQQARSLGVFVIHAPSDTMDFYQGSPARRRMSDAPHVPLPDPQPHPDPPQPIDSSDGGSDTGEKPWHKAWSRQHGAIEIDPRRDGVTDSGQEVWNALQQRGIKNVMVLGVHTNMCVLNRSFAIKALVSRGVNVVLVRDLTDPMYNPARSPYVDHEVGKQLMVGYIEKFWCPTIHSGQILAAARHE